MIEKINFSTQSLGIRFLVIIVGQKCNLKCRHCANFTPLLEQSYFDFESLKKDILKIARVAHVDLLQIQGGEPIGCPFLDELLNYILELRMATTIQIATNAVKPLSDKQIAVIKKGDICVRISNYSVVSKSAARMIDQCIENGIRYNVYQFASGNGEWFDLGGLEMEESSAAAATLTYSSCAFKGCLTLENGILARCSRGTTAHLAQHFTPWEMDHFSVRDNENIEVFGQNLTEYVTNPKAMRACAFCKGSQRGFVEAGAQFSKSEFTELMSRQHEHPRSANGA